MTENMARLNQTLKPSARHAYVKTPQEQFPGVIPGEVFLAEKGKTGESGVNRMILSMNIRNTIFNHT